MQYKVLATRFVRLIRPRILPPPLVSESGVPFVLLASIADERDVSLFVVNDCYTIVKQSNELIAVDRCSLDLRRSP